MRVIHPRPGRAAVILEDDRAHESGIALEVLDARSPRPQHAPQPIGVQRMQRLIVNRRFDHDLVRAEPVARFEGAVRAHTGLAFDLQHRMAIGDDAHRPSGCIRRTALAPREDLRARIGFSALAQRTQRRRILETHRWQVKVFTPPERSEIYGDDASGNRIGPELSCYHPGLKAS